MLPEKCKLRKCLEPYREPPKAVLSFFRKNDGEADYAVIGKTFSAEGKSVYALLYYSPERLERASLINRKFDCVDVVPNTPVKWYQTILFTRRDVKTVLLNAGGFYSYFKVSNRNRPPFRYLEHEISERKEADSLRRHIENVKRKNAAYNAEMRPVPKSFFQYARKVQSYGLFDTSDRHNGHCKECGKDFQTDSVLKYKCRHTCPHCGSDLTMYTKLTIPRYSVEYGVQYFDRDINDEIVVRHFLVTKYFNLSACKVSYFEYERDRFKANVDGYAYYFQVLRWNFRADQYLWRDSKPYQGSLWGMRKIFYEDEYLYTDNLDSVFPDAPEYIETFKILIENNKIRAEEYLRRLDVAFDVARDFIIKGYPKLLYNYYPSQLANESVENCLHGIGDSYREIVKETGFVSKYTLDEIRKIQTMSFDLFKLFFRHAKEKGLNRIEFIIGALRYGPHISEKLIKAGYSAIWKSMSYNEFEKYDDYSLKEILKHLTPAYKRFIKRRQSTTMNDIELLRRQCVKGVSIDGFKKMVCRIREIISYRHDLSSVYIWSDFIDRCDQYNVSVHKALNYLEDNNFHCWDDMCKWHLQLFGKPKRNALLVKSMMTIHDELFKLIQEKRDKESQQKAAIMNSLIGRICRFFTKNKLQNYELKNGLIAVVPRCKEDFTREGNEMHICVGGSSYTMNHIKKSSVIFFIRQSDAVDSPYCCCEARVLNGRVYLAQCRMVFNNAPEEFIRKAAEDYCKVLNKTIQFKSNALMLKAA